MRSVSLCSLNVHKKTHHARTVNIIPNPESIRRDKVSHERGAQRAVSM